MLVLMRRKGDTIAIGNDVVIHVSEIRNGAVKLAIDAPISVRIVRGETIVDGKLHGCESGGAESVTEDVEQGRGKDV